MFTDPISDYLTRLRNAQKAGHKIVDIPSSNMICHRITTNYHDYYQEHYIYNLQSPTS